MDLYKGTNILQKQNRKGTQSKGERLLYELLCESFPNLNIIPNDRSILEPLEIDIAIPELSVAIEWNGVFHYKPISGMKKFNRIQRNDREKQRRLKEMEWTLYIVPANRKFSKSFVQKQHRYIKRRIKEKIKKVS